MSDEVDLAMELSIATNQVHNLEQRLHAVLFDSISFSTLTIELIDNLIAPDAEKAAALVKRLLEWSIDIDAHGLLNLIDPVGPTRFIPLHFKNLSRAKQDALVLLAADEFKDAAELSVRKVYDTWDAYADAANRGTRSQRLRLLDQTYGKKIQGIINGKKQKAETP